jgi:hypothetical protein
MKNYLSAQMRETIQTWHTLAGELAAAGSAALAKGSEIPADLKDRAERYGRACAHAYVGLPLALLACKPVFDLASAAREAALPLTHA